MGIRPSAYCRTSWPDSQGDIFTEDRLPEVGGKISCVICKDVIERIAILRNSNVQDRTDGQDAHKHGDHLVKQPAAIFRDYAMDLELMTQGPALISRGMASRVSLGT